MRDITFPSRLFTRGLRGLTRQLFLEAYEVSDDTFWRQQGQPHRWRSLGGLVEFADDFLAVAQEDGESVYLATFRAAAHADLKRVDLKIKVKKRGAIHEQRIRLDRLTTVPVRKALDGLPLRPKRAKSTSGAKLGDVYIKLVTAIDSDGVDLVKQQKIATIFAPTCTFSSVHRYAKRWGQYWNIDEINRAKQLIKNDWYRRLVQSVGQLWRPLRMRRTAYWLLTNPLALSVTFWSSNLVHAAGLRGAIGAREARAERPEAVPAPNALLHGKPVAAAA